MTADSIRSADVALARRCAAGERDAQRAFFGAQRRRVHHVLYRILGSNRDIDDAVQDAFVAIFGALRSYRGEALLSTFVDRITTRVAVRYLRERPRARAPLELVATVDEVGPDRRAEAREALRRLYAILDRIEPSMRVAFTLHVLDGRSVREVASMTEASAVATRVRVFRARRAIEKQAARDPLLRSFLVTEEDSP